MTRETPPAIGYNVKKELKKFANNPTGIFDDPAFISAPEKEQNMVGKAEAENIRYVIGEILAGIGRQKCSMPARQFGELLCDINALAFDRGLKAMGTKDPNEEEPTAAEKKPPKKRKSTADEDTDPLIFGTTAKKTLERERVWIERIIRDITSHSND